MRSLAVFVCFCFCVRCALLLSLHGTGCGSCCLATRCCRTLCAYLAASVWLEQENESVKSGTSSRSLSSACGACGWSKQQQPSTAMSDDNDDALALAWPYVWSPLRRAAICDWASWPAPLCLSVFRYRVVIVGGGDVVVRNCRLRVELGLLGWEWAQ